MRLNRAVQIVCTVKKINIPMTDVMKSRRLPSLSTTVEARRPQNKFQIDKIPLMSSYIRINTTSERKG